MENAARLNLSHPMTLESLGEGLQSFKGQALRELVRYRAANSSSRYSNKQGNKVRMFAEWRAVGSIRFLSFLQVF
jgi:hypothetical protein